MRILISADIEGVSGVVHPEQTKPGSGEYERARLLLTAEVNACVEGAVAGGASDIVVVDAHGSYRNILFDKLHPQAKLIAGKPRLFGMMSGIDTEVFDGVFLLGYHARAGSYGVLSHTINGNAFSLITIDGEPCGEIFLNAALAGEFGVPIAFVSGDDCVANECYFLPNVEIVTTKHALANRAALNFSAQTVHKNLTKSASVAINKLKSGGLPLFRLENSSHLVEVHSTQTVFADLFSQVEGVQRIEPRVISFKADNIKIVIKMLNVFSSLAASIS